MMRKIPAGVACGVTRFMFTMKNDDLSGVIFSTTDTESLKLWIIDSLPEDISLRG